MGMFDGMLSKLTNPIVRALGLVFASDPWPHFESEVMPSWLQALGYLEQSALYLLDNKSLGFAFTGSPLTGVSDGTMDKLAGLLQGQMPKDSVLQFMIWTSPDMERPLTAFALDRVNAEPGFLSNARDQFIEYYRDGATHSVVKGADVRLRDVRLVITGKVPIAEAVPTDEEIRRVMELRDVISAGLKACEFNLTLMKPQDYLRFMQTIFNWRKDAGWRRGTVTEYDDERPLTEQILDFNNEVRIDEHGLWLGDQRARVLSPKAYPSRATFGQAYNYLGDTLSGANGLRDPSLLCMNLWFRDRKSEEAAIESETMWITNQAGQGITRFRPEILEQKKSFDLAKKALGDGDRIVRMCFGLVIFSKDDRASTAAVANAQAYMGTFGFKLLEDTYFSGPMFGNFMPFGTDPSSHQIMKRWKRTTTRGVVPLLPIMAEWRGTGTPTLLPISRNGQLMSVSNFDSETNYNLAIAAESGSGKSFLAQALLINARMMGARFWLIDKGGSYRNTVEQMGGQVLTFGPNSTLCLNPFTIVDDYAESEDLLYSLIGAMAALSEPLTDLQGSEVKRIMGETFRSVGPAEMKVDHLAQALLESPDSRVQDVGRQLYPFTQAGGYGRLFHGRNNYQADNPVILLELDDLEGRAHLQKVVLLQLMFQIQRDMRRLPKSMHKYLLIDEAWELLAGTSVSGGADPVAEFVGGAYRRFRKAGGAAITITQSVTDFFKNDVTRAIWENSAHRWLLGQKGDAIERAKREGYLVMGEHGFRVLRGVRTVPGEYSEVFFSTPFGYGVGRLIVPPVMRKVFSTAPADTSRMAALRAQGLDLIEAARRMAIEDGHLAPDVAVPGAVR